jgi:hypothetical protein
MSESEELTGFLTTTRDKARRSRWMRPVERVKKFRIKEPYATRGEIFEGGASYRKVQS